MLSLLSRATLSVTTSHHGTLWQAAAENIYCSPHGPHLHLLIPRLHPTQCCEGFKTLYSRDDSTVVSSKKLILAGSVCADVVDTVSGILCMVLDVKVDLWVLSCVVLWLLDRASES